MLLGRLQQHSRLRFAQRAVEAVLRHRGLDRLRGRGSSRRRQGERPLAPAARPPIVHGGEGLFVEQAAGDAR